MLKLNIKSLALTTLLAGMALSGCYPASLFAADDYLGALEAEAADIGAKNEPVSATVRAPVKKVKPGGASELIAEGLSFSGFEKTLGDNYSGSNFLYMKLSKSKRKSVYRIYQNDNRISSVREEIVRLLSSG